VPANPPLATAHSNARKRLETVYLLRIALYRGCPQRSRRDAFAAADHLAVGYVVEKMRRTWISPFKRAAKARLAREPAIQRRNTRPVDRLSKILKYRECRALSLQFGNVGAADGSAIAGKIDTRRT
jgi:hypothetical protein